MRDTVGPPQPPLILSSPPQAGVSKDGLPARARRPIWPRTEFFAASIGSKTMPDSAAVDSVIAGLNYVVDTGVKPVNRTMESGNMARVRTGTYETHDTVIRNGRPLRDGFSLDGTGFVFVDHPTGTVDFFRPGGPGLDLLPGGRGADRAPDRRATGAGVRPHAALGQRGDAGRAQGARAGHPGAQRLHRMVGTPARPRPAAGRGRKTAPAPLRHRPGVARDRRADRVPPDRHRRRAQPRAGKPRRRRAALSRPGWARPTRSPTPRGTGGTTSRA